MKRTTRILAGAAAAAVAMVGGIITAAPAVADIIAPTEYCSPVTITQPNPDHVPAVAEAGHWETVIDTPAIDEVSHTEWRYLPASGSAEHWSAKDAGRVLVYDWTLYYATGETRVVIDVAAQPAITHDVWVVDVAAVPAVGEATIEVETGEYACTNLPVTWQSPTYAPNATDWASIGKPQPFVGIGTIPATACGTTRQHDTYTGTWSDISALWADGLLTEVDGQPEDAALVTGWSFSSGPACPPPATPTAAIITVEWPTPVDPTCDADGYLAFEGTPAQNPNGVERDGYHLYVNGTVTEGKVGPGTYTLTAYRIGGAGGFGYPAPGTLLIEQEGDTPAKSLTHSITVLAATGDCPVIEEPPVEEEPPAAPTVEEPQIGTAASVDTLATTGTETIGLLALVGALFAAGGLVIIGRRIHAMRPGVRRGR